MIYQKLFQLSGLRKTDINTKLGLRNNERQRFERSKKIELSKLVEFANALNVSKKELTDIVFEELSNMYKR